MKMMRQFFESWTDDAIGQPMAVQLGKTEANAFMSIGFTHHMAIIHGLQNLSKDKEPHP